MISTWKPSGVLHLFRCLCQLMPLPLQHVIHNLTPRQEPVFFSNCDQRIAPLTKTTEQTKYNEKTPQVEFSKNPCCLRISCFPSRVWKVPRSNRCSSVNIGRSISFHTVSMSQKLPNGKEIYIDFLLLDLSMLCNCNSRDIAKLQWYSGMFGLLLYSWLQK